MNFLAVLFLAASASAQEKPNTAVLAAQIEEEVKGKPGVATGPEAATPAGWCYGGKNHGQKPYGTMTAGDAMSVEIQPG